MARISIGEDCGNSPKNIFVQEITIALTKGDLKSLLNSVTDDIRWNVVGDRVIQGKDSFAEDLEEKKRDKAVELNLDHIATHGKAGAADGRIIRKSKKKYAFCHVYEFSNAKGIARKSPPTELKSNKTNIPLTRSTLHGDPDHWWYPKCWSFSNSGTN
ncbi:MAG TPA: nuclear transport factor 2 family protein [Anaerolineales bacterium]|nr:nuclear transport factor 2 family protein [Anaerolineales bacterium]